jgi:hypothetical protein
MRTLPPLGSGHSLLKRTAVIDSASQPARVMTSLFPISVDTISDHGPRPGSISASPSTRISSAMDAFVRRIAFSL